MRTITGISLPALLIMACGGAGPPGAPASDGDAGSTGQVNDAGPGIGEAGIGDGAGAASDSGATVGPSPEAGAEAGADGAVDGGPGFDWGKAVVDSTMKRFPDSTALGWEYSRALFLHGAYLVYKRLQDPAYLAYIKTWADSNIDAAGNIGNTFDSLDSMMPANVLLDLFAETGDARYGKAPAAIRARLDTYPRTGDGGFWHNTGLTGQTWGDGAFMALPLLARYGQMFNDVAYASDETTKQLLVYHDHLKDVNGLHYHAWDETGAAGWTNPATKHSPEVWCRAVGWYAVASILVLDVLPPAHPNRPQVLATLGGLIDAFKSYQDPATGRWFQVVDKGADPNDWLETSCSSMFTFVVSRAVQQGYVAATYAGVAAKGYAGVLQEISLGTDGQTNLADVCVATSPGNLAYYYAQPRATNDFHGLGSFLIMYEQLR